MQLQYIKQYNKVSVKNKAEEEINLFSFSRYAICLFNPFNIIISTRGSSDALICALNLWTMFEIFKGNYILSAFIHGALAIHLRIFPVCLLFFIGI
jgi:hypothetical protein